MIRPDQILYGPIFRDRFSKIFIFSIIDKIFSCKIALEIHNRPGYYLRQYGTYPYTGSL